MTTFTTSITEDNVHKLVQRVNDGETIQYTHTDGDTYTLETQDFSSKLTATMRDKQGELDDILFESELMALGEIELTTI